MSGFIEAFKAKFSKHAQSQGHGGCDTCGYGAEDVIGECDYEDMLKEMDEWISATFSKEES
jgi:hypothetical protein